VNREAHFKLTVIETESAVGLMTGNTQADDLDEIVEVDYLKLCADIEADFQKLVYGEVQRLKEKMAVRCAEIDVNQPLSLRQYGDVVMNGVNGYRNDSLGTLVSHYINTFDEVDGLIWRDASHFWQHLKEDRADILHHGITIPSKL
tara:strand:- start:248 stop:685 length:438 start_codon:yes stop_codon:yes gene_type:complete